MNEEIIQLIDTMDGRQKYDAMCKAFFRYYDIFKYLSAVFASDKENIQKYIDMDRNPQIREEVGKMSGMGQSIYDKGIEQGVMQGIIKMGYDLNLSDSEIIKQLQTQLGTSLQKAQEYLDKFGRQTV